MAEAKTKPTNQSVATFIKKIPDPEIREDCFTIAKLMTEATRCKPQMWGTAIVGFGTRRIQYAGGREDDWPLIAFSPRKQNLTLYVMTRSDTHKELLKTLGKHKVAGSCLHFKRLSDIDVPTFEKLIRESVKQKKRGAKKS